MTAKTDNYSFLEKELEFAKLEIANLHDDIHEWMDKCDALSAKIEHMEKQEPVAIQHREPSVNFRGECVGYSEWKDGKGLEHWPRQSKNYSWYD